MMWWKAKKYENETDINNNQDNDEVEENMTYDDENIINDNENMIDEEELENESCYLNAVSPNKIPVVEFTSTKDIVSNPDIKEKESDDKSSKKQNISKDLNECNILKKLFSHNSSGAILDRLKIYLRAGVNPNQSSKATGTTPLMYLLKNNHNQSALPLVKELIEHGADPKLSAFSGTMKNMNAFSVLEEFHKGPNKLSILKLLMTKY